MANRPDTRAAHALLRVNEGRRTGTTNEVRPGAEEGKEETAMEGKVGRWGWAKPVVIGLVAGVAVGAAAGILFAPKAGKDTRKSLGDAIHRVRSRVASHSQVGTQGK